MGINMHVSDWSETYYDDSNTGKNITCGVINIDLDGPKKGNDTAGMDLFRLSITKEGIKPIANNSSEFLKDDPIIVFRVVMAVQDG